MKLKKFKVEEIFGVGSGSNFFLTYLCKQSTLLLEVQPHLFVFDLSTLWASFELFLGPSGHLFAIWVFFGQDQIQNTLLEPTNIDDDFLF